MKKDVIWLLCVMIVTVLGVVSCSLFAKENSHDAQIDVANAASVSDVDPDMLILVDEYVQKTRHWPKKMYQIIKKRDEGNVSVFWVVYKDDNNSRVPGGGNSFEIHVDVTNKKVIAEYRFQ